MAPGQAPLPTRIASSEFTAIRVSRADGFRDTRLCAAGLEMAKKIGDRSKFPSNEEIPAAARGL